MTMLRYALVGAACLASAATADAQARETFRNSWFWGVKAGVVNISTAADPRVSRPTFGLEWLITRSAAGLYVSADFADFDVRGSVADQAGAGGRRDVDANNLRRVGFAALAFPRTFGPVRPYGGIGFTLDVVGSATAVPDTAGGTVSPAVGDRIEDARSRTAFQALAGVQAQVKRVAAFAQFTYVPATEGFLLNDSSLRFLEFGIRYNFGTSIARAGQR